MLQQPSSIDQLEECLDRFRLMRASRPVSYDEARQSWHLVCYQEVLQVLADTSHFVPPGVYANASHSTSSAGPLFPRVAQSLLSQVLTPRSVGDLTPRVREITHSLLREVRPAGTIDVIENFAAPLAGSVLAELIGIPLKQRVAFVELANAQRKGPADEQAEEISLVFSELIAQRREKPQNDLISTLLTTSVDNALASDADVMACLRWLVGTGSEMVTHLLGNAVLCLLLHPEVIERLHQDPAPIYSTIEEVLRYLPPVWRVMRMTRGEVVVGGQPLPAQARICAWI